MLGRFLGTAGPKKVALFAGSLSYRGHEEREMGFRHILAEEFPNLQIVELREMRDDREKAYSRGDQRCSTATPTSPASTISAPATRASRARLQERGRERSVVFIGHEATDGNKALLLDGTIDAVIDQNPRVEAREALNILQERDPRPALRATPAAAADHLQGEHPGDLTVTIASG